METKKKFNFKKFFVFYRPTLNIICFVEKKNLRFCLCIFESDTVKSDCPVHFIERFNTDCWFTYYLEILKKKKKNSENDQLTGHFQSFLIYFFFIPTSLNLKKNSINQLIKKFWPEDDRVERSA